MSEPIANAMKPEADAAATVLPVAEKGSYGEALKSTSIIGGSAAIMMVVRMVRTKALTLLLGPLGVGLESFYNNILEMARMTASLGIGSSGVRQIAAAVATGDEQAVAATVTTLRRITLVSGTIGAIALFLLRRPISVVTFGNADHALDVGILAIALLFTAVNGGQGALLQGMRRIKELALMGIMGIVLGTLVSIPIVWKFGTRGVVWYIVIGAANMVLMSWYYARRIKVKKVAVPAEQIVSEGWAMFKLGMVLTWSGLLYQGTMYLLRDFIRVEDGLPAVGQFSAACQLSVVYVNFILQAMSTDFYPRLTGVATDNEKSCRMVNEQVEVSLLLALPGILATVAFAPWIMRFFYSAEFGPATEILCWQMGGMIMRVACTPLGMALVARGSKWSYLFTEVVSAIVYTLVCWLGLKIYHLPGTGIGFVVAFAFYWVLEYTVLRRLMGFKWSRINLMLQLLGLVMVAATLVMHFFLPLIWGTVAGATLAAGVGVYCLKILIGLVGVEKINRRLRRFKIQLPGS